MSVSFRFESLFVAGYSFSEQELEDMLEKKNPEIFTQAVGIQKLRFNFWWSLLELFTTAFLAADCGVTLRRTPDENSHHCSQ